MISNIFLGMLLSKTRSYLFIIALIKVTSFLKFAERIVSVFVKPKIKSSPNQNKTPKK